MSVEVDSPVAQNEICYIYRGGVKLMAEVIKVIGKKDVYKRQEQLFLEFDNANFQNHIFNRNQQFNPDSTIPENY